MNRFDARAVAMGSWAFIFVEAVFFVFYDLPGTLQNWFLFVFFLLVALLTTVFSEAARREEIEQ